MKMGTAQKQNIAVQHRIWNKHRRPQPMGFKEWLEDGIRYYQSKGFTFELLTPSLMRIKRPGQNSLLRTCANFREEYEKDYLPKF